MLRLAGSTPASGTRPFSSTNRISGYGLEDMGLNPVRGANGVSSSVGKSAGLWDQMSRVRSSPNTPNEK